jgi:hypothetical protein
MKTENITIKNNEIGQVAVSDKVSLPVAPIPLEKGQNNNPLENLSKALTPFRAFKEGFEEAIASFLMEGQEVKKTDISEKPIKNTETLLMEKIVKSLLKDFNSVRFVKNRNHYVALMDGKVYQFSILLEKTDFNQISLTDKELIHYHKMIKNQQFSMGTSLDRRELKKLNEDPDIRKLTFGEREALNIYSGSGYSPMNTLLRGDIDGITGFYFHDTLTQKESANLAIKETLLHAAVAISGLNKLPDFVPPIGPDGKQQTYLYRAENSLPDDILKKRKWSVLTGNPTKEMGFISTSYFKPAEGFFSEFSNSGILIECLKAKKITALSAFKDAEREVLLPPTQMLWLYHKDVVTDVFKNTIPLFIAKPVTINDTNPIKPEDLFVNILTADENAMLGIHIA